MWSHRDTTAMQYVWLFVILLAILGGTMVVFLG